MENLLTCKQILSTYDQLMENLLTCKQILSTYFLRKL